MWVNEVFLQWRHKVCLKHLDVITLGVGMEQKGSYIIDLKTSKSLWTDWESQGKNGIPRPDVQRDVRPRHVQLAPLDLLIRVRKKRLLFIDDAYFDSYCRIENQLSLKNRRQKLMLE